MKQYTLMLIDKKSLEWEIQELPALGVNEVLIKTVISAVSVGAELSQYDESDVTDINPDYPRNTGYENYGEVVRVGGNVRSVHTGDKVVAFYGHKDFSIEKENNVIPVSEDIPSTQALLTILSCDSAKGVLKLDPNPKDKVLVTGMGTIGLLAVYFLKHYIGVDHIDVIEPDCRRRHIAKEFGAKNAFDLQDKLEGKYEHGLECSGMHGAFGILQSSIRQYGKICILSDGNKEELKLGPEFYEKELCIVGSSDGWDYKRHSQWFFKYVKKTPYIDQIFEYETTKENLMQCFKELSNGTINPLKVLVRY
ncbi:alcohol dehydrogenase catalytic domain-containing protein [Virgibacillus sp. NKC19-16]|uniref:alcohol dehydrogenase catalytic domain-containing protein n=1 Tax=Virgibacillus salidurans TaxID=2831673 RepID=UPI001F314D2B|nr:alcohol dehydrogenase catalytic domain-containing protein [Virgibacillus sp. NKC19-16]UJL47102.1 alcohol dehydrogenase catalytic domain-containing protein [Virgibacillus sp. NKC19-16]